MILKRGVVVSHSGVDAWGSGKVIEIADFNATIQFSDGITRKIASSHFDVLQPADPATYIPTEASEQPAKTVIPRARKKKVVSPTVDIC